MVYNARSMSRRHPLSYPGRAQTQFHARINERVPHDYYSMVFHSSFMRGPFKKISLHGTVPIIIGAAATATGHSQMLVRSIAIMVCAVWLSLDIGVWISETQWQRQYKTMAFCVSSSFLCCLTMGIMYWFMLSTLEEQQEETFNKMLATVNIPPSGEPMDSIFTVVNGGKTALGEHKVLCRVNLGVYEGHRILKNTDIESGESYSTPILSGGDAHSSICAPPVIGGASKPKPLCIDLTYTFEYVLETQTNIWRKKDFRFVADAHDGFQWHQQPVSTLRSFCETFSQN